MSKVYTDPENYTNIAEAIREKTGSNELYKPADMPAAIRSIETDPNIVPLTVIENGTYLPEANEDGFSPVVVSVSTGGGAHVALHFPRLCEGDPRVDIHSDCELVNGLSAENAEVSHAFTEIVKTDDLDAYLTINTVDASAGTILECKLLPSGYANQNGESDKARIPVQTLLFSDLYEGPASSLWWHRKVLYRMTVLRYHSKMDSGTDNADFTNGFRSVGSLGADIKRISLDGNSIITIGGLVIRVNNRDASIYSSWKEEGTVQGLKFMKVRWEGMSVYSDGTPDQEYEVICLSNGDVMFHLIKKGRMTDGQTNFYGTSFPCSLDKPNISFYRKEPYGSSWEIVEESYTLAHHNPEADIIWHSRRLSDEYKNVSRGMRIDNGTKYDDNSYTYSFPFNFTWHGNSYIVANGNSWIGIGRSSEDVRMHRRDSAMSYLYCDTAQLSDINNLKALHLIWGGSSHYSGAVDRWWSLWLFENGDAMIYISAYGANTGTSAFFNQTYTANNDSVISFYYDPNANNYVIIYEKYNIEHHIDG